MVAVRHLARHHCCQCCPQHQQQLNACQCPRPLPLLLLLFVFLLVVVVLLLRCGCGARPVLPGLLQQQLPLLPPMCLLTGLMQGLP